jgi:hypothetical protein
MHIKPPIASISFEISVSPKEAEELAKDARAILAEESSTPDPVLSSSLKKILEVLQLLPQQFS